MNTPAHLILGAAIFARPDRPRITAAALMGSFLPDLSLYAMVLWHRMVIGTPDRVIFDQVYFSATWQQVFAIDNSVLLWLGLLVVGVASRLRWLVVLAAAGMLHLALDFPLHHDDGRAHFWPVSDWIFESPVSYWDPDAYGQIVGVIEILLCMALLALLWRRFPGRVARGVIAGASLAVIAPPLLFALMLG